MRVLHVAGNFPLPPLGGVENIIVHLAEELPRLGLDVRVVGAARQAGHQSAFGSDFFAVSTATISNWVRVPTLTALSTVREGIRWADVVHVHNPPELFNFAAIEAVFRAGKPLVLTLFSPGQLARHPRRSYRWPARVGEWLVRRDSLHASVVQVCNQLDYDYVAAWGCAPEIVPFGIAEPLISSPRPARPREPGSRMATGYPRLLFVGRLHPMKGPEHFVQVTEILRRESPQIRAVVVGPDFEGSLGRLQDLAGRLGISDCIEFRGPVLDELEKLSLFDSADVVVIPSLADFVEGFSIVASEAWSRGIPVAAYPVGALKVRVKEGENGSLARSIDPIALSHAVRRALALRSVPTPSDVVGWPAVGRRFLDIYRRAASG